MSPRIVALSGGVGGAKLAQGLAAVLEPKDLLIVANTGDDFQHLGLTICPDLDSVMYALAGVNDTARGWGLAGESWAFMQAIQSLGGASWFQLGDRDLATHVLRSAVLGESKCLTEATAALTKGLGIKHRLVPMCEDSVRTLVSSDEGELAFQHYFVKRQCEPKVSGFRFAGVESAQMQSEFKASLTSDALQAVILCPSNPFVSIAPILAVPGVRSALADLSLPIVAVSPLIAGKALKGPAAKMMSELQMPQTSLAIAEHYVGLVTHFVLDEADAALAPAVESLGMRALVMPSIMVTDEDKQRLATDILQAVDAA